IGRGKRIFGWNRENLAGSGKAEILQQPRDFLSHAADSRVGSQASDKPALQPWLILVDLPWMEIDAGGMAFTVKAANTGRRIAIRQQTQVSAAPDGRDRAARKLCRGDWNFKQRPGAGSNQLSMAAVSDDSVTVVRDWINAGIPRKTALGQDV